MSKMLDEAIENYLKNMRLNINFFISFLDKNSSSKLKTQEFLDQYPQRNKFTQAYNIVPTSLLSIVYTINFSKFLLTFISLSWFLPQLGQV